MRSLGRLSFLGSREGDRERGGRTRLIVFLSLGVDASQSSFDLIDILREEESVQTEEMRCKEVDIALETGLEWRDTESDELWCRGVWRGSR